jgi:acyl carrier protein
MSPADTLRAALGEVGVTPDELAPDRPLETLGIDSFDILEVIATVEDELGIQIDIAALRGLRTVGDLFEAVGAP